MQSGQAARSLSWLLSFCQLTQTSRRPAQLNKTPRFRVRLYCEGFRVIISSPGSLWVYWFYVGLTSRYGSITAFWRGFRPPPTPHPSSQGTLALKTWRTFCHLYSVLYSQNQSHEADYGWRQSTVCAGCQSTAETLHLNIRGIQADKITQNACFGLTWVHPSTTGRTC